MRGKLGADWWISAGIGAIFIGAAVTVMTSLVAWWVAVIPLILFTVVVLVAWLQNGRRTRGQQFFTERPTPRLAPILVVLPTVLSVRQSNTVTIAVLAALALFVLIRQVGAKPQKVSYLPAILLLVCVGVTFRSDAYGIALLFVLAGFILFVAANSIPREVAYNSLLAGLTLYLVANVVGWQAGLQSPAAAIRIGGYNTEGGLFGDTRVFFPFTRAINEGSYVAATLIVAVVAMIKLRQKPRWYHLLGVIAGLVVLLAANSRTPMLVLVLVAGAILLIPRIARGAAPYVISGALTIPFVLGYLQPVFRSLATLAVEIPYLARGQNIDQVAGLGTRGTIWARSLSFWNNHVGSISDQWIGFGYNGHAKSGASAYYASGIGDFLTTRTALTMHNSVLQLLFDAGIIGAVILLVITVFAVYRYGRNPELLPMFAVVVMVALSGVSEVSLAPGLSQTPAFLLLYLLVFIPTKTTASKSMVGKSSTRVERTEVGAYP